MENDTDTEIIEATKHVLCTHGYADLTIQRIADEASLTTAAIHYHFDTKEELLHAFLDDLIERFDDRLSCDAGDPRERIEAFLDAIFLPVEDGRGDGPIALMELKSQAPFHAAYRERFQEFDERLRRLVADAVSDGVAAGDFERVDPATVARFVVTLINGCHVRDVALGESPQQTRALIEQYLSEQLGYREESRS